MRGLHPKSQENAALGKQLPLGIGAAASGGAGGAGAGRCHHQLKSLERVRVIKSPQLQPAPVHLVIALAIQQRTTVPPQAELEAARHLKYG